MGRVTIVAIPGKEFKTVVAAMKEIDKSLPKQLRRQLREAVKPLAEQARANVRAIPTHGDKTTGLREKVARGVGIRTSTRNLVRVTTRMPQKNMAVIPRGLDTESGWRHPVFGDKNVWVQQKTGGSWFREEIAEGRDEVAEELQEVLDNAAKTVARAGGPIILRRR
ncbi:hypothetical protein GCM10012275_28240 [Longimycelium tulufanense]|uniref:Uncharacterized protein n=1 Tax=Longimycelium tulufanense TaxID=907463 RepID=A0A8J3C8E6_9PSEU|nr:hypothetical protein [Longimycelium tulufanense]GGM55474.1 hypothetical protein GCM10012275_28240 [Longimycelium tulufanense]